MKTTDETGKAFVHKADEACYAKGAGKVDLKIFLPSLAIILAVAIPLCLNPSFGKIMVEQTRLFITGKFGWIFMWAPMVCLIIILWLCFSPHGKIKLGNPNEKPEFSYFSWVSMLFCCGVGSSIIVWGVCEPIYYIDQPPLGLAPRSREAYEMSLALPIFHWGLSAWAVYALAAVAMAYSFFVRKNPNIRLSTACEGLLKPQATRGASGSILEILVVIGSVGGFGTSLGLGVPFVSEFISSYFNIPNDLFLKAGVILTWTAIFCLSVFKGVAKGMQVLSRVNIWLAFIVLIFVFLYGPTFFILDSFTTSIGLLFNNFFSLSLSTEAFNFTIDPATLETSRQAGFPQNWTVFYWCWWVALAPISGIFLGRISKGRTIRETIMGIVFWGSLGCAVTLSILGAYSIHLEYTGALNVSAMVKEFGAGPAAAKVLMSLPHAGLLMPIYILLAMVFLATTLDAAAFSLASICTKALKDDEQPARWHRLLWALVLGGFSMGLLITGGPKAESLYTIQASAVAAGLPLLAGLAVVVWALIHNLKKRRPEGDKT